MLKNKLFAISPSDKNGGLASLVLNNDSDHMNWIEGTGTWGVPFGFEFVRMEKNGNSVTAYYKRDTLLVTAVRTMENNLLRERYSFRNSGTFDLYFLRGDIGLYANFSDDYDSSPVCITSRCNAPHLERRRKLLYSRSQNGAVSYGTSSCFDQRLS